MAKYAVDLYRYYDLPSELLGYGQEHLLPMRIVNRVIHSQNQGQTYQLSDQERQSLLSDANWALRYTRVVQKPWPQAEALFLQDPARAYSYASQVLDHAWPDAEPVIARSGYISYLYARYVLEGPFPLGEPAIKREGLNKEYRKFLSRSQPDAELDDELWDD